MWTHLCNSRDWPLLPHHSSFVQGGTGPEADIWIAEVGAGPPQPCWTLVFLPKQQGWLCIAGPSIQWSLQSPLSPEHNPSTVIINTTPRLLPLKSFGFDLWGVANSWSNGSQAPRAIPAAAALSSRKEHFPRQAGKQVRFSNGYGMEI